MRQVVVYALYAWCVISLVMLVVYRVRRGRQTEEIAGGDTAATSNSPELLATDPVDQKAVDQKAVDQKAAREKAEVAMPETTPEPVEAPVVSQPVNATSPDPAPSPEAAPTPASASETSQPEPDTVEVPALSSISAAAAAPASSVPPTDVPLTSVPVASATPMAASTNSKTLSDLLSGFQLPHDLMPIIPDHDHISERQVSLMTSSAPVEIVGPAVADELERLGFELTPMSENELLAVRDNDSLTLTMVMSPTTAEYGGRLMYPQANPGDVVITIEVTDKSS